MLYMHQSGQRRGEERMNPIFKRTSIRQWTDEPVSREQILDLLKAGMQAPSAVNSQPWEFAVVTDPEVKKRLSEISPYSHFAADAPVIIALLCRKENSCPPYNQIDMGICTENILLEAVELGLGAVMLGVCPLQDRMDAMAEILDLPEGVEAFGLIPVGHPKAEKEQVSRFDESRIRWID